MRRFLIALGAISLPMTALADADNWRTLRVEMLLHSDGSLSVVEHASVLMPEDMTLVKRRYWSDSNEHVTVLRVIRVDPDGKETPEAFDTTSWGQLQIKVPPGGEGPKNLEYRIESRVTGVVLPVWGIPRAVRQMDFPAVVPPLDRLKEIVSLWRQAGLHPGSRYLLDYQFFFPDDQNNVDIQPTLSFAREWKAVHPGSSHVVVKSPTFGFADPLAGSVRVTELFDYAGSGVPAAVDIRAHRIRVFSIAAFPIIAVLICLIYFGWRILTRPKIGAIDERWLREHLFNEPAEVVAAKLGGWPSSPSIESFLRRLERDGKIALDIRAIDEGTDDEDHVVNIRLRVPREQLSEYERLVIDALMPKGNEVDSREIQQRHSGTDFDPMKNAEKWLHDLRDKARSAKRSPGLSRLFSFALFAAGMWLIVLDLTRNSAEPVPLFATLIFLSPLVAVWPTRRISLIWIPLLLMSAFLAIVHTITPQPLGIYTSVGVLLALVGTFHAIAAEAAVRGKPADLIAAEAWLRSPQAHVRTEWRPYLEALGIEKASTKEVSDEDWGSTLSTFAESSRRQ